MEIVQLTKEMAKDASWLIASAFLDEPGAVAVSKRDDPVRRLRILRRYFAALLSAHSIPKGASRCAVLDRRTVGVMTVSVPDEKTVPATDIFGIVCRLLPFVSPAIIWRGFRSSIPDEHHRPSDPHYYLEIIAVDPHFQGSGIGKALVSHLTAQADREDVLTYLSTTDPKTVPFYEKHGFGVTATTHYMGIPNIHMVREPENHGE